jgi:type VI secretion system protein ImpH
MPPDDLNALARLRSHPHEFSLFAALRLCEQAFAEQPRLGESRRAADDPVRLGQAAHLMFAPSDLAAVRAGEDAPMQLEQYAFGLFGPNGALPLHFTELAYERRRQKDDATLVDFINLFQHRLISLFYRAWAEAEPTVSLDRPEDDRFRAYVGALIGTAPAAACGADAVPDFAKLHRAGLFAAHARSAEGLEAILADYFEVPVAVRQFVGAWLEIPDELRCRLGSVSGASLSVDATLGTSTWQCQHKFEIALGPLTREMFVEFLPGAAGLTALHALVRFYTNDEWDWQLRLLASDTEIPGVELARGQAESASRLGWTSWLGKRSSDAADVVIQASRTAATS